MTNRYAPTCFVGLGGSGVHILRSVKAMMKESTGSSFAAEPVTFCAFDLDPSSNLGGDQRFLPLVAGSEFYPIEGHVVSDCVKSIVTRPETHREIRAWYPDNEGKHITVAQASPAGAGQWRPLGRIAFWLHRPMIAKAIGDAVTNVDHKLTNGLIPDVSRNLWFVSSTAGGTGAGALIDAAVNARVVWPRWNVRGFLLLPEIFGGNAYIANVLANTYGVLKELAAFTSGQASFVADYPDGHSIGVEKTVPPFEDIYLIGPYRGNLRPFRTTQEAHGYLARILETASGSSLRAASKSAGNNRTAAISSPTARHVFSTLSGVGIPLLSYQELADFVLVTLASELAANDPASAPMFDLLQPPIASNEFDKRLGEVTNLLDDTHREDRLKVVTDKDQLRAWVEKSRPAGWTPKALQDFVENIAAHCELERVLQETVEEGKRRSRAILDALGDKRHPYRNRTTVERLLREIRRRRPPTRPRIDFDTIKGVAKWLRGGIAERILAVPVTDARIDLLTDFIVSEFQRIGKQGQQQLYESILIEQLEKELERIDREESEAWNAAGGFAALLKEEIEDPWTERRNSVRFDVALRHDATSILHRELNRSDIQPAVAVDLRGRILTWFHESYTAYRTAADKAAVVSRLVDAVRPVFAHDLGRVEDVNVQLDFVPLSSLLPTESLAGVVMAANSPLFRPGRSDSSHGRVARVVIPQRYKKQQDRLKEAGHGRLASDAVIEDLCAGYLQAIVEPTIAATGDRRESISILLEDHNHPADHLEGFFDYASDYRRSVKALHHIHRDYVALPELIGDIPSQNRVLCGNAGCVTDITGVQRDALFCHGCRQPIRNRCGNAHCLANGLAATLSTPPPSNCLSCGDPLRTAWWPCPRHGLVSMDEPACPDCMASPNAHPALRPEPLTWYVCPGCVEQKTKKPAVYTGAVADVMRRGSAGRKHAEAKNLLKQTLPDGFSCRLCGALLAPLCPATGPESPHLVAWDEQTQRFRCSGHRSIVILTCGHCRLPVGENERRCRRCRRSLKKCRFCTPRMSRKVSYEDGDRCPICHLPPETPSELPPIVAAADHERFCSNIYGCAVGASLMSAVYAPPTSVCEHCRNSELALLEVFSRPYHLSACAFCAMLFHWKEPKPAADVRGNCCLCGQSLSATTGMKFVESDDRVQLMIAKGLVRHSWDDRAAFRFILKCTGVPPCDLLPHLNEFLMRIERMAVRREAGRRIEAILRILRVEFGCRCAEQKSDCNGPERSEQPLEPESPATERDARLEQRIRSLRPEEAASFAQELAHEPLTREQVIEMFGRLQLVDNRVYQAVMDAFEKNSK